jgi:hypothetical protein
MERGGMKTIVHIVMGGVMTIASYRGFLGLSSDLVNGALPIAVLVLYLLASRFIDEINGI